MSFGFHPFANELQKELGIGVVDPLRASIAALQIAKTLNIRLGPPPPPLERPKDLMAFLSTLEKKFSLSQ
jgi:hypothetical protein